MVREKKKRIQDIEKLHELIDSASLPKQKTYSAHDDERLEGLRKRLSDNAEIDREQQSPFGKGASSTNSLQPRIVIHKKDDIKKKDEKVIQIDLGPREIKKEKGSEPTPVSFIHVKEDPFAQMTLFEIEKAPCAPQEFKVANEPDLKEKSTVETEFIPVVSVRDTQAIKAAEDKGVKKKQPFVVLDNTITKTIAQKKETLNKGQFISSSVPEEKKSEIPVFEPVEFTAIATEKDQEKPLIGDLQEEKEKEQKKTDKKQAKLEAKEREKLAKQHRKEREKKHKEELLQTKQKQREEQRQREEKLKLAVVQAEYKEQEEKHLLKEQEQKSRQEQLDVLNKQRQNRKQKKLNAKKARLELKEKKREAKRLAKEHDRKLKLEWLEFQRTQRQNQRTKSFEEKKAAVKEKEKQQEERRLLKQREQQLRVEQQTLRKKQKEELKEKKRQEKQAKLQTKEKEQQEKRRAEEEKKKQQHKQFFDEQRQKEIEKKKALALEEKQRIQEQHVLKKTNKIAPVKEGKKKEGLEEKSRTAKKAKKIPLASSVEVKKEPSSITQEKKGMFQKKKDRLKKEEEPLSRPLSFREKTVKKFDIRMSPLEVEETRKNTQKSIVKLQKQEQKRLKQQQKEQEHRERLELKEKQREEKLQQNQEEELRGKIFNKQQENKVLLRKKKKEEKLARQQTKEKVQREKRLLKDQQKKKDKAYALKEIQIKDREKKQRKQEEIEDKKERQQMSLLGIGKAKETKVIDERKKAELQKNTMELVRIAAEEKELRKTKAFERKMEKERKKREREELKMKRKEEERAKKKMDIHMKEEIIKEKTTNHSERNDPYVAFDSIDNETALLLSNFGFNSVEKLRQASVKELVKIGIKKKNAQRIIAECQEFVEWEVFDVADHF